MNELRLLVQNIIEHPPVVKPKNVGNKCHHQRYSLLSEQERKTEFRGEELKKMRERHGLSKTEMARLMKISERTYASYERNQYGIPKYRYTEIIYLLGGDANRG